MELTDERKQELQSEVQLYARAGIAESYLAGLPEHEREYLMEWIGEFAKALSKAVMPMLDAIVAWWAEVMAAVMPAIQKVADFLVKWYPRLMKKPYGVTPMPSWLRAGVRVRPNVRLPALE